TPTMLVVASTSTVMVSKATFLGYVTKEEVQRIHEEKNKSLSFSKFDLKLPYLARTGHAHEHVMKFMETLRLARLNNDFKLKEFSKPLIEKTYTSNVILTPSYYIKCFREKVVDIQDSHGENELHLENLALSTFATLVEATRRTNNIVQRQRGANQFTRRDTLTVNMIQGEGIEKEIRGPPQPNLCLKRVLLIACGRAMFGGLAAAG
ncbi:hypothetical protein J1N35_037522, partial [Gossypium stocksii]